MNTKTLCLGVLILGKSSGYDIGKKIEQEFGHFMDVASSGVYHALKVLLEEGLVEFEKIEQNSLPDKKVYSITEQGKEVLTNELNQLAPRHKVRSQFLLLLYFSELLSEQRLQEVFQERIKELTFWTEFAGDWLKNKPCPTQTKGQEFMAEYALTVMSAERQFLEKNSSRLTDQLQELEKTDLEFHEEKQ